MEQDIWCDDKWHRHRVPHDFFSFSQYWILSTHLFADDITVYSKTRLTIRLAHHPLDGFALTRRLCLHRLYAFYRVWLLQRQRIQGLTQTLPETFGSLPYGIRSHSASEFSVSSVPDMCLCAGCSCQYRRRTHVQAPLYLQLLASHAFCPYNSRYCITVSRNNQKMRQSFTKKSWMNTISNTFILSLILSWET